MKYQFIFAIFWQNLVPTINEKSSRYLGSVGYTGKMSYYKDDNLSLSIRAVFWNTWYKQIAGNANRLSLQSHAGICARDAEYRKYNLENR